MYFEQKNKTFWALEERSYFTKILSVQQSPNIITISAHKKKESTFQIHTFVNRHYDKHGAK